MIADYDALVDDAFACLWELSPGSAVYLGRHDYDGLLPDWTAGNVARVLDELQAISDRLSLLDDLDTDQALDRRILQAAIAATRFDWHELRGPLRNPMEWVYQLDPDLYMKRAFAPDDVRAGIVADLLEGAPALLELARERLDAVMPRTFVEWGVEAATGLAGMIRDDVAVTFTVGDSALALRLEQTAVRAADALEEFASWLRTERGPSADESFPIGAARLERLLTLNEMVTMSLDEMLEMAEADLAANRDAFIAVANDLDDTLGPREVYQRYVAAVHCRPGELVATTRDMLEDIRSFLIEKDLITIPSEVRARVAETPPHLRWAFAMMDTPGPYEKVSTEAYYYVTPVDPKWSDEEAEQWLQALNTFALEDISIHEAYPGHYVHFLHYPNAPTEVSRRLSSYAFTEGWAHYCEQMMWEQGYRAGDPRFRLAQLSEALVRNCRFVCAIRLHAHGMSVDEATAFFIENAFYEELPARKEAERGTFDPGYFSYTLGKLEILELRERLQREMGREFSLKAFHDALLSRGAPPVAILERVMT